MKNKIFLSVLGLALLLGSCIVDEESIRVESVTVTPTSLNMAIGEKATIAATVLPVDADNKSILWSSSHEDVATVSSTGQISALGVGHTVIMARAADNGCSAICEVEVYPHSIPLESISIKEKLLSMYVMDIDTIEYFLYPKISTVNDLSWSSSDNSVVMVMDSVLMARSEGEATIYLSAAAGSIIDSCKVTVNPLLFPLQSISLSRDTLNLIVKQSDTLCCILAPEYTTEKVNWTSSNNDVAIVGNGVVTGLNPGSTTIYAMGALETVIDSCIVIVSDKVIKLESLTLNAESISIHPHESDTLICNLFPKNTTEYKLKWISSNPEVAVVNHGVVTALVEGLTTIYASSVDGNIVDSCSVTVAPHTTPLVKLDLSKHELTLSEKESATLACILMPSNTTDTQVEWTSEDSTVAIVSGGVVTALSEGSTRIYARGAGGSIEDYCSVTVICKVTGVALFNHEQTCESGSTLKLSAKVYPSRATNQKVKWSSCNPDVATVDNLGKVTALKADTVTIIVTTDDGGFQDKCVLTIVNPVSGLNLKDHSITMFMNREEDLTPLIAEAGISGVKINWVSDNPSVADVKDGKVKAFNVGTARIVAVTSDGSNVIICNVSVFEPVFGVYLNLPDTVSLYIGDQQTTEPTVLPQEAPNKKLVWNSSDPTVAKVNDDGTITAVGKGYAVVYASAFVDDNVRDSVVVHVMQHVEGVKLEPIVASVYEGETIALKSTVLPVDADDRQLSYESDKKEVADVDQDGTVHGISAGSATITVKTHEGKKTAQCQVTVLCHLDSISFAEPEIAGFVNERIMVSDIQPLFHPERATDNPGLEWKSSKQFIAMLVPDPEGLYIKLLAKGEATITATSVDDPDIHASFTLTVLERSESLTLTPTSTELYEDETVKLKATVKPYDSPSLVKWSSDNESVATVSDDGTVTAVSGGTAVIRAEATDNQDHYAECTITVMSHATGVKITKQSNISLGGTFQFEAEVTPADAGNKNVTWSSSDPSVVSINAKTGLAKAEKYSEEPVTITATTEDGNHPASCQVLVIPYIDGMDLYFNGERVSTGATLVWYTGDGPLPLEAKVFPEGMNDNVTWTSSKKVIEPVNGKLSVLSSGTNIGLTAVSEGMKSDGSHATASVIVNVYNHIKTVSLDKTELKLYPGGTQVLKLEFDPTFVNKNVIWESDNESVATVNADGTVTAISTGSAVVTLTTEDGKKTATCNVKVLDPVTQITGISFSKESLDLEEGIDAFLFPDKQFFITPLDATIKELHWEVPADQSVARILLDDNTLTTSLDTDGRVNIKAIGPGSTALTVTAIKDGSNISATLLINVKAPQKVESISISPASLTVIKGKSETISVTVSPSDAKNKGIDWSWDSNVVSVSGTDNSATITGLKAGKTTITATAKDGSNKQATCSVEVIEEVLVESLRFIKEDGSTARQMTIYSGDIVPICDVEILPKNATNKVLDYSAVSGNITFSSSERLITAIRAGTTKITVGTTDGSEVYTSIQIQVKDRPVESITMPATAFVQPGAIFTLTPTIEPFNATKKTVTWSTSDKSVATVSNGVVTGVANGTATITCTATDGSGKKAECVVTVANVSTGEDVGFDDWN